MKYASGHDVQAAHWAYVLRDPHADPLDIEQALAWLSRSSQNQIAFDRVQQFLDACDNIDADLSANLLKKRQRARATDWPIRSAMAAGILILLATATTMVTQIADRKTSVAAPAQVVHLTSAVGELKTFVLRDKSTIMLSGASSVSVMINSTERRIELQRGEALFEVASDRRRPFIVQTDSGTATALGTQFNVHRDGKGATVTVIKGRVAVNGHSSSNRPDVVVGPFMQVSYDDFGAMSPVSRHVDVDSVLAWRTGTLIFSGETLSRVVQELNRYSRQQVVIEDMELAHTPVSGVVRIDRIEEWLHGLSKVLHISVEHSPNRMLLRRQDRRVYPIA